jgi:hypothetical protein
MVLVLARFDSLWFRTDFAIVKFFRKRTHQVIIKTKKLIGIDWVQTLNNLHQIVIEIFLLQFQFLPQEYCS